MCKQLPSSFIITFSGSKHMAIAKSVFMCLVCNNGFTGVLKKIVLVL